MCKPITVREDLIEYLDRYSIPELSILLRQIVLEYVSKQIKGGFSPDFEKNVPGIVMLLDYLACCDEPKQKRRKGTKSKLIANQNTEEKQT